MTDNSVSINYNIIDFNYVSIQRNGILLTNISSPILTYSDNTVLGGTLYSYSLVPYNTMSRPGYTFKLSDIVTKSWVRNIFIIGLSSNSMDISFNCSDISYISLNTYLVDGTLVKNNIFPKNTITSNISIGSLTSYTTYKFELIPYNSVISPGIPKSIISQTRNSYSLPNTDMLFCHSVRLIVSTYSGPVIQVTRSTDNLSADFYTDMYQTYLKTIDNISLNSWLTNGNSTADAIVNKIYDQSGKQNHLINGYSLLLVPYNGMYIILSNNFSKINLTTAVSPTNMGLLFQISQNGKYIQTIISTAKDYSIRLISNSLYGGSVVSDFIYNNRTNSTTYVNGINTTTVSVYTTATPTFNTCGVSMSNVIWRYGGTATSFNTVLHNVPTYGNARSLSGYFTEIICFDTTLTTSTMQDYYNKRLIK